MKQPGPLELTSASERRTAVQQAHQHISSQLDLRRFRPGDRLPSAEALAKEIGVSRPAVLQALRLLENDGRVVVRSGRGGSWVTEHQPDNLEARVSRAWQNRDTIIQMAHLREILEPGVASLVAARGMSAIHRAEARALMQAMLETPESDVEGYRSLDTEFHLLVARSTEMPVIESVVAMCRREVAAAFDVMDVPRDRRQSSNAEHREILDALERGDTRRAAAAALVHVSASTLHLEQVLSGKREPAARRRDTATTRTLHQLGVVERRARPKTGA